VKSTESVASFKRSPSPVQPSASSAASVAAVSVQLSAVSENEGPAQERGLLFLVILKVSTAS
jgi:hypothetical protein